MALLINLRLLETKNLELAGKLPAADLDLEGVDECVHLNQPVDYQLEVQQVENEILVQGSLAVDLDCDCVRCLKPLIHRLEIEDWACLLPLEGEEKAEVKNDSIDLTPYIREDILLGFPQHPLCNAECKGLQKRSPKKSKKTTGTAEQNATEKSAWAELNKLKF